MAHPHLTTYLNDHLAGSTAALEILAEFEEMEGWKDWATQLSVEVTRDRQDLEMLMRRAQIDPNRIRQAAAWMTERLAEFKTFVDDPGDGALRQLELIEALGLGIDGKRALWASLQRAATRVPILQSVDYARLIQRAEEQRHQVEERRLALALAAFGEP